MMSRSRLYPAGLGNSSGRLGKDFIPHMTAGVQCCLGPLIGKSLSNDEGFLDHAYMPSFMHLQKRDYARSFGAQFNYQNRRSVGWARQMPGFGKSFKESVKSHFPAFLTFSPYGEKLPDSRNYVDLDESKTDAWGLPLARRHVVWTENDLKIFADMNKWAHAVLENSGGQEITHDHEPKTNHEVGGCRMGSDPKTSVLDAFCRSHDVPNLYVVDGSAFPSASEKNPPPTIMPLAPRT